MTDTISKTTAYAWLAPPPLQVSKMAAYVLFLPPAVPAIGERTTEFAALAAVRVASGELRLSSIPLLTAINFPTPLMNASTLEGLVVVKHSPPLLTTEAAVLVAIKEASETHLLRAWTFTQDDHDFYVLGLGNLYPTFVLDLSTNQWSEWNTEGRQNWRTSTGIAWDNDNVAGDLDLGVIWNIDENDRLDGFSEDEDDIRTIVTVVRGLMAMRLRTALSCARAVLEISEYDPAAAGGYVTLKTSDDFGKSWHDHGTLIADDPEVTYDMAWASLGLIAAPGRIFEITEAGVTRRIDGLDVDLGADEGKVQTGG